MTMARQIAVIGPIQMAYDDAVSLQTRLRDECARKGCNRDFLLFVEHPHTITVGVKGEASEVLAEAQRLKELGVEIHKTNRGGQVTYHGPGQLVGYPILNLRERGRDLHRYLRDLEQWLVALCRGYGVDAHADSPHTGVWVEDRKIASIGIAARQWVSYHGIALNVTTDLEFFDLIVPCGQPDCPMTSLLAETGEERTLEDVAADAAEVFAEHFDMELVEDDDAGGAE
jgi:lipoate-protein ligase B